MSKVGTAAKVAAKIVKRTAPYVAKGAKTAATGPVASRVTGALTAMHGIKSGDVLDTALGAAMLAFNHDSWLEHYDLTGLVNLNFGRARSLFEPVVGKVTNNSYSNDSIPTVLGIELHPTVCNDPTFSWGTAFQKLDHTIRQANSGARNWSIYDLEKYVLTVRSLHAGLCHFVRALGILNTFNVYDSSMPASICAAAGIDYDSYSKEAANLRQLVNIWSEQIAALAPLSLDFIERTKYLFSNIFVDSDDAKAQMILFQPKELLYMDYPSPGTMTLTTLADTTLTPSGTSAVSYAQSVANFQKVVNAFVNNPIFSTIAGDILKAFGKDALQTPVLVDINYKIQPVYDQEALTQIQNAVIPAEHLASLTVGSGSNQFTVTNVKFQRFDALADDAIMSNVLAGPYVNAYKDSVSATEALKFTYLSVSAKGQFAADAIDVYVGDYIATDAFVIFRNEDSNMYGKFSVAELGLRYIDTADIATEVPDTIMAWAAVDWAPMTVVTSDSSTLPTSGVLFDWNNYARPSADDIAMFHGYAIRSLLYKDVLVRQSRTEVVKQPAITVSSKSRKGR
nr:putative capsid [Marmot picobirnavirus]